MARIEYSPQTTNNYKRAKLHNRHRPMSPSSTLRTSSASRQKPYPQAVGKTPPSLDTPGTFQPDETGQRKSYATILTSGAADNQTVSPLGHDDKAWSPLASMAIDPPPPKTFVWKKDPVPPDPNPSTTPPRRRRPRTRRSRRTPPTSPTHTSPTSPPITSHSEMIATMSTIINSIHLDSMDTLRVYFQEEISKIQQHITTKLKAALTTAIKELDLRQRDAITRLRRELKPKRSPKPPKLNNSTINCPHNRSSLRDGDLNRDLKRETGSSDDDNSDSTGDRSGYNETDVDRQGGGYRDFSNGDRDADECPPGCGCFACDMRVGNRNVVNCRNIFGNHGIINPHVQYEGEVGHNSFSDDGYCDKDGYGDDGNCSSSKVGYHSEGGISNGGYSEGGFSGGNSQGDY